jgi:hypothetical protein
MSKHPVEKLLSDIRHGRILLTKDEILQEAGRHPLTKAYFEKNPSALDPFADDEDDNPGGNPNPSSLSRPKGLGRVKPSSQRELPRKPLTQGTDSSNPRITAEDIEDQKRLLAELES